MKENIRREKLFAALPLYGWNVHKAALAVGYSKYYAKNRLPFILQEDVSFCERMNEKKREIAQEGQDDAKKCIAKLQKIIGSTTEITSNVLRAIELRMKSLNMLAERRIVENIDRQRELTESEKAEARRLAQIRLANTG